MKYCSNRAIKARLFYRATGGDATVRAVTMRVLDLMDARFIRQSGAMFLEGDGSQIQPHRVAWESQSPPNEVEVGKRGNRSSRFDPQMLELAVRLGQ